MSNTAIKCLLPLVLASSICLVPIKLTRAQEKPNANSFFDEDLGVKLTLPDTSWKQTDQSQGNVKVFIFSADPRMATRCTVMSLPKIFLPQGILRTGRAFRAKGLPPKTVPSNRLLPGG